MKIHSIILIVALGVLSAVASAWAQSVQYLDCVVNGSTCGSYLDGHGAWVPSAPSYVVVAGYQSPLDGGGGEFFKGSMCPNQLSFAGTTQAPPNANTVSVSSTSGLAVGYAITDTLGYIPAGAEISSIQGSPTNTITITQAATSFGSTTLSAFGNNHGTQIQDSSPSTRCWYKTNYRGDPHEWGAIGDDNNDDTTAIQNWLGAYGSAVSKTTAIPPTNFGPWIANIPSNYKVSQPLICPTNANIQAQANLAVSNPSNGPAGSPAVRIFASNSFQGGPAVLTASAYCRLTGVTIDANNSGNVHPQPTGTVTPGSAIITSMPSITGIQPGMRITDPNGQIPANTTVLSITGGTCPCSVTLTNLATGSSAASETLSIGIDAVDVAGTHVAIDGHSLLENGFYNVDCGYQKVDGLQIKDAEILTSFDDGLHLTNCANVRLIGDLISGNGASGGIDQSGVYFSGEEISIEGGVIEESGGPGLFLDSASQASVTGMYFDNNGDNLAGPAIKLANSKYISICGNHIHRSGGSVMPNTSHVLFSGQLDNIDLCGNVYYPDSSTGNVTMRPYYVYDVATGAGSASLTNTHLYEAPSIQMESVFSTAAAPLLQNLQVPQITQSQINGLTLSNDATHPGTVLDIAAGEAADSTNAAVLVSPSCTINFNTTGPNGLDTGSFVSGTTYFIYLIGSPGQLGTATGTNPTSCMASLSPVAPTFQYSKFHPSGYIQTTTGWAVAGSPILNNVISPIAVAPGQAITSTDSPDPIASNTTVAAFQPIIIANVMGTSGTAGSPSLTVSPITGVLAGMVVQDPNNICIPANTYIQSISGSVLTLSQNLNAGCSIPPSINVQVSAGYQIQMSQNAANTSAAGVASHVTFSTGLYRMIGAVYSTSAITPTLVQFTQDGDTFYLASPVNDLNTSVLVSPPSPLLTLNSVPSGVSVEAFGRCVAGTNPVVMFTPLATYGSATAYPTAPGYDVQSNSGTSPVGTTFPFRIHTNTSQQISARAGTGSSTLQCMTDGWVWKRAP